MVRNDPLPDGNKRAALLSVWLFMEQSDAPSAEDPDTEVPMAERIAAGEATPNEIVAWLEGRAAPDC
jgi:prophage maintenance system killer protein